MRRMSYTTLLVGWWGRKRNVFGMIVRLALAIVILVFDGRRSFDVLRCQRHNCSRTALVVCEEPEERATAFFAVAFACSRSRDDR